VLCTERILNFETRKLAKDTHVSVCHYEIRHTYLYRYYLFILYLVTLAISKTTLLGMVLYDAEWIMNSKDCRRNFCVLIWRFIPECVVKFYVLQNVSGAWGSVVVKALRYYSDGPGIDSRWCHWIFQWHISFRQYHDPGVDSAPSENEYQEHFLVVKAASAWGWYHHLNVPNVMKSGSLNLLEPSGSHRACYDTPLPLTLQNVSQNSRCPCWDSKKRPSKSCYENL
jgi:hypothetical protein